MSAIPCASVSMKTMADGTLRISFDIEPMHAQDAFRLFAAPGTPAAIAALQVGYAAASNNAPNIDESAPNIEKPKGGALSKLAGMWCHDQEFKNWINDNDHEGSSWHCEDANDAKFFVCEICGIESRAELDHNDWAAELFHSKIRGPYSKHLIARGIVS